MEYRVSINEDVDVTRAVMQVRRSAAEIGFDSSRVAMLATAASELARNILKYAESGTLIVRDVDDGSRIGIEVEAVDLGPGIDDIDNAMRDHVSAAGTLGLGLPGVKRLTDEFEIRSAPGQGTTVTARKWLA